MYQIQGKYLWGGEGWEENMDGTAIAVGGLTLTAVLGAVAVAISAVNIAGGFAVTFRMLVRNHCPHHHRSLRARLMVLFRRRCSPPAMTWLRREPGTPRANTNPNCLGCVEWKKSRQRHFF